MIDIRRTNFGVKIKNKQAKVARLCALVKLQRDINRFDQSQQPLLSDNAMLDYFTLHSSECLFRMVVDVFFEVRSSHMDIIPCDL